MAEMEHKDDCLSIVQVVGADPEVSLRAALVTELIQAVTGH